MEYISNLSVYTSMYSLNCTQIQILLTAIVLHTAYNMSNDEIIPSSHEFEPEPCPCLYVVLF